MDFSYSSEDFDNYKLITLYGNLSLSVCSEFERFLRDNLKKQNLVIDMRDIRVITTSGMNIFVTAGIDAKNIGKRVIIMRPGSDLREMIERMHNYEYFIIVDSIEEAKMKIKYYTYYGNYKDAVRKSGYIFCRFRCSYR